MGIRFVRVLRRLIALFVRGRDARFIRADLEEIYERDRAQGVPAWDAHARYTRAVFASAWAAWRENRRQSIGSGAGPASALRRDSMLQDVRFALRLFRKHPAPAGIAAGGLAIAIAAASSVFTLVNATMLRPYGVDDPRSLFSVGRSEARWPYWPIGTFTAVRETATLSRVEGSIGGNVRVSTSPGGDELGRRALFVSGGYMQVLGGRPAIGRMLDASDNRPEAAPVAVVSHRFWSTVLNSDPTAVGKPVWLNGTAVTVVGVVQREFTGPVSFDLRPAIWVPFERYDDVVVGARSDAIASTEVETFARPIAGTTMEAARDEIDAIVRQVRQSTASPSTQPVPAVQLSPAGSPIDRDAADSYLAIGVFFGIAALVLAVACANTANLLLAAATTRQREMGIRLAMGAGTERLVGQLLNESLLLALVAGGLGFLLTFQLVPVLGGILQLPPDLDLAPDLRVLLITIAVAAACGLVTGLWPARYGARGHVLAALQSEGDRGGSTRSGVRTAFVVLQAGVSMFLLVVSALLVRSSIRMESVDLGFDADRLISVVLPERRSPAENEAYLQAVAAAARNVPSVEAVALSEYQPMGWRVSLDHLPHDGRSYQITINRTDAAFFATAGLTIVRGRGFTADEVASEAPVALISENVARGFFGDVDPLGQSLAAVPGEGGETRAPATIIGVLAESMTVPLYGRIGGSIYQPLGRTPDRPGGVIVRTSRPERVLRQLEAAVRRVDPRAQPEVIDVRERLDAFLSGKRTLAWLSAPTAVLSLVLAALGLFGVTAFVVGRRMTEIGLRLALGASSGDVMRLLIRDSLRPASIGITGGLLLSLAAGQVMANEFLAGISPRDPIAMVASAGAMLIATLAAVLGPARRASKVNPATLLSRP